MVIHFIVILHKTARISFQFSLFRLQLSRYRTFILFYFIFLSRDFLLNCIFLTLKISISSNIIVQNQTSDLKVCSSFGLDDLVIINRDYNHQQILITSTINNFQQANFFAIRLQFSSLIRTRNRDMKTAANELLDSFQAF